MFVLFHAFMYIDLSLSFFICGKNVLREFAILIMGDQKSRKVNKYQNIFAILKTATVYFPCLKKEPHPKVIIASCATYQLWLKVTIKILPTIFFLSSAWYRTWWWLRGFFFTRRRKTYLFWRPIEFWRNSNKDAYSDPHLNNPFLLVTYAIFGISRLILSNDKLSSLVYKNVLFRFGVLYSSTIVPFGYWQKNST